MTDSVQDRLTDILDSLQAHLEGDLGGSRAAASHPGARGEASEDDWLRVLNDHMPGRYRADRAFVIDARGECSEQIDIVIYDHQYSPYLYNQARQRYVPAESVYGVIEVKQDLNREHVLYAAHKAASVRRLSRTSAPVPHVEGLAKPRALPRIVAGIVTYQSSWSPPFGSPLREALGGLHADNQLDIGCALLDGTFEARYRDGRDVELTVADGPRSLVQFLMRLMKRLQALATAPAIDYDAYLARFQRADDTVKQGGGQNEK